MPFIYYSSGNSQVKKRMHSSLVLISGNMCVFVCVCLNLLCVAKE